MNKFPEQEHVFILARFIVLFAAAIQTARQTYLGKSAMQDGIRNVPTQELEKLLPLWVGDEQKRCIARKRRLLAQIDRALVALRRPDSTRNWAYQPARHYELSKLQILILNRMT